MWSRNYDCCIVCGLTKYRYKCRGMCYKCYNKVNYEELLIKNPNEQQERYVRAKHRNPDRNKDVYNKRILSNPNWNKDMYKRYADEHQEKTEKNKEKRRQQDAAVSFFSTLQASAVGG